MYFNGFYIQILYFVDDWLRAKEKLVEAKEPPCLNELDDLSNMMTLALHLHSIHLHHHEPVFKQYKIRKIYVPILQNIHNVSAMIKRHPYNNCNLTEVSSTLFS